MCDTKWGFNTNYGHRTLPFKWQSSNGFHFYEESPLTKKNFRPSHLPALREDFLPMTTQYGERAQDKRWAMSGYGCHRNLIWDDSLRMPRNPFAGKPNREMTYVKESPLLSTPRRLAQWDMQRTMRGSSTPRMKHIIPLPELNRRHREVLEKSTEELAAMMRLFED
ncbi:PX domain-containing protein [Durusdinium trenchii]|uniref:PX domain-containing protein n=1 Tax=Durusdinium trenchii TaxID=1381693 RepID=A0ABP0NH80_9DINO